jgi:hypothetical protein
MDIAKTIEHLQQEKQKLEQAIAALEELRRTSGCLQDPARPTVVGVARGGVSMNAKRSPGA